MIKVFVVTLLISMVFANPVGKYEGEAKILTQESKIDANLVDKDQEKAKILTQDSKSIANTVDNDEEKAKILNQDSKSDINPVDKDEEKAKILNQDSKSDANPVDKDEGKAKILNQDDKSDGKGNHEFSYETSNGISRYERWYLKNAGTPKEHIAVEGQYSYIDSNGETITIIYYADENGFVALPEDKPPDRFGTVPAHVLATLLGGG